jgi:hypothetical protein
MATKKITELAELVTATNDDVFPIVDVGNDITKKIKTVNLPISSATQTALNLKEDQANKSTDVATDQASNTKYPSVKAVYDWAVGLFATIAQLATKQDTLVSGTNIKTINSTSLLGTGDISIQANPSGGAGAIQFSNGSAFASDSNLFWDNTNKRLGVGTNTPTARMQIRGSGDTSATIALLVQNSAGNPAFTVTDSRSSNFEGLVTFSSNVTFRGANDTQSLLNMRFVVPGATKTFLINKDYANSPSASALLQVDSTTQGFLPPRMTTTQKNAISSPAAGLMVYDTTLNQMSYYNGTSWVNF